jgi:uncharacterized repeat protein (TIGR02543 family)
MPYKLKVKSLISLLLSVLLVMTLLPVTARAATVNVETEQELKTAILNASDGDIISVNADITVTEATYTLSVIRSITLTSANGSTLDLGGNNGSRIYISSGSEARFDGNLKITGSDTYVVYVWGTLTLAGDASIEQTKNGEVYAVYNNSGGTVNITGGNIQSTRYAVHNNSGGTANITGGDIEGTFIGIANFGELAISEGSIQGSYAVSVGAGATADISGGTFTGTTQYALSCGGTANITGGTFNGTVRTTSGTINVDTTDGNVTFTDGVGFDQGGHTRNYLSEIPDPDDMAIGSPETLTLQGVYSGVSFSIDSDETPAGLGASISGNTVTLNPTLPGTHSLVLTANAAGDDSQLLRLTIPVTVTGSALVCKIGDDGYATLEDALDAVQDNETITFLQSINYSEPIVIDGKTITFGLGSFDLNIDTSETAGSTGLTARNSGKVSCSGSGKLNVEGSKEGVRAEDGSEIHVSGSVTAGQYGVYTVSDGTGNPEVTVDGDVTVTGQGASGEVEAISAGGYATVEIGGHVTANRTAYTQNVTAVYSNGSTVTVGKDVTTKGSGVNVQNDGEVTIDGALDFDPTGTGPQSYIKAGTGSEGVKTADDFEDTSTKPGYKEYKNGDNIVWIKGAEQLGKPTGLAWDTSVPEALKATWDAVPNAGQYKVEYYKDGSKLGMSTIVNSPSTSTGDIKDNLLVWGGGSYTFTLQATAAMGSSYSNSEISEPSGPYSYTPGGTTYSVTVNGSYASSTGAGSYAEGATVTINAGNRAGYTFTGWTSSDVTITNAGNKAASFTMPAKNVTVTANWSYKGGGSSGSPKPPKPTYNADVKEETGSETTLPVTVNYNKETASTDTGSGKLSSGKTIVTMPSITGVETYSIGIPVPDLSTSEVQGTLALHTDNGIITVPSNMLTGVPGISGSRAQISIGQGDKTTLPEDVKAAIGNRPLVRLALSIDGKQTNWFNPGAPVTVSIPYTPTAAELANPESIVVWYIDGSGNAVCVPNGRYDPVAGSVTFITTHFSHYAVGYNKVSFKDVPGDAWHNKAVSFIAARGITTGTGSGNFSPDAKLVRVDFLVLLMKAYSISPDANPEDNFSDAGNTYYTGYLAAAKRLGISAGAGNNRFAPGKEITRQEMFTLLYNALKAIGMLPQGNSGKALSDFTDDGQISPWSKKAMTVLVETGTIGGSNGKLHPMSTTTRAEIAQVLYNLMSK